MKPPPSCYISFLQSLEAHGIGVPFPLRHDNDFLMANFSLP
jgi:hypothetical protein